MSLTLQSRPLADAPSSDRLSPLWWLWLPLFCGIVLAAAARQGLEFYNDWFNGEDDGILEYGQFLVIAAAFVVALATLPAAWRRGPRWLFGWVLLAALCCFYVAGEEVSWGQHIVGWSTPEAWSELNDQNETNLHNVSSWLDQKPRHLLSLGVIVGGFVIPLYALFRPELRRRRYGILLPPFVCLPVAAMACITGLSWFLDDFVRPGFLLFIRPSEVQEFYFYVFTLLYLIVLNRRIVAWPATTEPQGH